MYKTTASCTLNYVLIISQLKKKHLKSYTMEAKIYHKEKTASSISGAGKIGQDVKE